MEMKIFVISFTVVNGCSLIIFIMRNMLFIDIPEHRFPSEVYSPL